MCVIKHVLPFNTCALTCVAVDVVMSWCYTTWACSGLPQLWQNGRRDGGGRGGVGVGVGRGVGKRYSLYKWFRKRISSAPGAKKEKNSESGPFDFFLNDHENEKNPSNFCSPLHGGGVPHLSSEVLHNFEVLLTRLALSFLGLGLHPPTVYLSQKSALQTPLDENLIGVGPHPHQGSENVIPCVSAVFAPHIFHLQTPPTMLGFSQCQAVSQIWHNGVFCRGGGGSYNAR